MNNLLIIFTVIFTILIIFYIIIINIDIKIKEIEHWIQKVLKNRADLIPGLFEISKKYLVKHNNIFDEVLKLRKVQFSLNDYNVSFIEFIKNEMAINHEIRFIYWICAKNKKLSSLWEFNYIKNLIIERNKLIWIQIEKYKKLITLFNNIIMIKNNSIIWILLPFNKKFELDLINNIF
jgi:hypothetical protein